MSVPIRFTPAVAAVLAAAAIVPPGASAAAGDPDTSFGTNGQLAFRYAPGDHTVVGHIEDGGAGTTLVAGSSSREADGWVQELTVARVTATGAFDSSFAGDGVVVLPEAGYDVDAVAAVRDGQGRIVVIGNRRSVARGEDGANLETGLVLVRLLASGQVDTTFGTAGYVRWTAAAGDSAVVTDVALDPDGRIVAGLELWGSGSQPSFTVMRFDTSGAADASFGAGGQARVAVDVSDGPLQLAVQPDGKVLGVSGGFDAEPRGQFRVVRLTASGALDGSFGTGGLASSAFADDHVWPHTLALRPDGTILVAGQAYREVNGEWVLGGALARFDASGALDPALDGDGMALLPIPNGHPMRLALRSGGSVLFSGTADAGSGYNGFAIGRLTAAAALDPAFGGDGVVASDDSGYAGSELAVQQGHAVVGGSVTAGDGTYEGRLYRYDATD